MVKHVLMLAILLRPIDTYGMDVKIFHKAVSSNNVKSVSDILKETPRIINMPGENNETALHIAAGESSAEMVSLLLDHKASIEAQNEGKETPLFSAVYAGNDTALKVLIQYGAKINILNHVVGIDGTYEHTPLHIAAALGHKDIAEMLLNAGADRSARGNMDLTPLVYARQYQEKNTGLIKLLKLVPPMPSLSSPDEGPVENPALLESIRFLRNGYQDDIAQQLKKRNKK